MLTVDVLNAPKNDINAGFASIAIIVPTYQEEAAIAICLQSLQAQEPPYEVIVTDGGSTDGTVAIVRGCQFSSSEGQDSPIRVLQAPHRSRASQMNFAAGQTRSDILLFLHADSRLPVGGLQAVRRAMAVPEVVGGRFAVRLDRQGFPYNAIQWGMNLRTRLTGTFTGDMGIFVRRSLFEELGGYPEQPLMEDFELSRRMKRRGNVAHLQQQIVTSSRRWQQYGPWRTVALMQAIRLGYQCGVPPNQLANWYRVVR